MARNQNTFAKLQREADKKAKAQAKRARRKQRKLLGGAATRPESQDGEPRADDETDADDPTGVPHNATARADTQGERSA